jgi:hypothetical protein
MCKTFFDDFLDEEDFCSEDCKNKAQDLSDESEHSNE